MLVTALVLALWFLLSGDRGVAMIVVAILAIGPASDMAVAIVNRAVTARWVRVRCHGSTSTMACRASCERWSLFRCC